MENRSGMMKRLLLAVLLLATPAFAGDLPLVQARPEPGSAEEFAGCSLACGIGWTTAVSSELAPQGSNRYGAASAEDADGRTCWASQGKAQWIEFRFTANGGDGPAVGPVPMRGLRLMNGYAKTEAAWRDNARLRTLQMSLNGKPIRKIRLEDRNGVQGATFAETPVKPGDVLRLTVLDTYAGRKHQDACLSEIVLDGAH